MLFFFLMHRPTFIMGLVTLSIPSTFLFLSVTYLFFIPLLTGILLIAFSFSRRASRFMWYSVAIATFAWVAPYSLIAYDEQTYDVEMVVPRNYVGDLTVICDQQKGSELQKIGKFYRFDFSNSPTIYLSDPWILHRWARYRVVSTDGEILGDESDPSSSSGTRVLNNLGSYLSSKQSSSTNAHVNGDPDGTEYRWRLEPAPPPVAPAIGQPARLP
jgi:hypothetical protein